MNVNNLYEKLYAELQAINALLQEKNSNKLTHIKIMLTITYTKVLTEWYTDQKYFWK
jgi:hypothetical protein